jgi:hypothetical protein
VVEGALEVVEDVLRSSEIGLMRVVHVKAHLLDRVGDVRPGEGEVPESPSQTTVGRQVVDNPCQRSPWLECQPTWSRACNRSC